MKKKIIFLIVLGFIVFSAGVMGGFFYGISAAPDRKIKNLPLCSEPKPCISDIPLARSVKDYLNSPVISFVTAMGTVKSISGSLVRISYNGAGLTVNLTNESVITSMKKDVNGVITPRQIDVADIKIGDNIRAHLKILENESLGASEVFITDVLPTPKK